MNLVTVSIVVQNPVGRIVNRFSKDQSLVDEILPSTAQVHCSSQTVLYYLNKLSSFYIWSELTDW